MAQFDVYKFDMTFSVAGFRAGTAFYYAQQDVDSSDGASIADALRPVLQTTLWDGYLQTLMSDQCSLIGSKCQKWAPTKDTPAIVAGLTSPGLIASPVLANQAAQVITKYPGTWSRNFIGRNYQPGAPEVNYIGNVILAAQQTIWQVAANSAELATVPISMPEALNFDQVVFSPTLFKVFDPLTGDIRDVYSIINSVVVQNVLGTQRSRRPPRTTAAV